MGKLVEEIRKERCKKCLFLRSLGPVIKCGASTRRCREEIRRDIALIGKAYADGELKLPREDGRWIYGGSPELPHWLAGMLAAESTTFVALSREEDSGD